MNEEEIIKIIKEYLSKIYIECTKVGAVGIPNEEWYAIQGLLDLYKQEKKEKEGIYTDYQDLGKEYHKLEEELNKEKEKNEKLEEKIASFEYALSNGEIETVNKFSDVKPTMLVSSYTYGKEVVNFIKKNFISKEKIRDKQIEREFELQQEYKDFEDDIEWRTYKELLEEE